MVIKIRYVFAIVLVSFGCVLSIIYDLAYSNWYAMLFGLLLVDPVMSKKNIRNS
jgi:hypothetical protein